jgi:hypothetical protein
MKRTIKLRESEMVSLIKQVLSEEYNPEKLYSRNYVVFKLRQGPRELKRFIKDLPHIDCVDGNGNPHTCTKIPEVVYVFLQGRY